MESPGFSSMDQVLRELSALLHLCEETLREEPLNQDAMFTKALFLLRAGDHLRALHYLHMVTDLDPRYPGVWHAKSMVYRSMGKASMAAHCAKMAAEHIDPD